MSGMPADPFKREGCDDDDLGRARLLWAALEEAALAKGLAAFHAAVGALSEDDLRWMVAERTLRDVEALARAARRRRGEKDR